MAASNDAGAFAPPSSNAAVIRTLDPLLLGLATLFAVLGVYAALRVAARARAAAAPNAWRVFAGCVLGAALLATYVVGGRALGMPENARPGDGGGLPVALLAAITLLLAATLLMGDAPAVAADGARPTLRGRIAGVFLVVTLLVGGLVLVALQEQMAGAERAAVYEAHHIARAIAIAGGTDSVGQPETLRRYLAQLHERDDRTVYVVDVTQRVVASFEPAQLGTTVRDAPSTAIAQVLADGVPRQALSLSGTPERLLVAPLRAVPTDGRSAVIGAMVVEYTDLHDMLAQEARASAERLFAIAIAVVLLIALLGSRLATAIATPIAALTRGASRLAGGSYDVDVPVTTRDEVGTLAAAFNAMARELRAGHARVLADHEALEGRVAERTDALRESNAHLSESNRRLRETQEQLLQVEKMASIGQLASGVAHEINNPIGYVYSNLGTLDKYFEGLLALLDRYAAAEERIADAATRDDIASAKQAMDIDFVKQDLVALLAESREGITRVKKIVQDLRNFSRTAGDEPWQPADLVAGIESTLNIVRNELKYKAEVVRAFAPLPLVECRPSQLNQVFMNLLVNAAQAIRERGTIRIATGVAGEDAWVEVSDTGDGIRPEHLSRVFDPFFTTKAVGQGTGLGLALSYRIIDEHHGRIEVESEVGVGTRFRVLLPIRQPRASGVRESDGETEVGVVPSAVNSAATSKLSLAPLAGRGLG